MVDDLLHDNSHHYQWRENNNCRFSADGYHVKVTQNYFTFACRAIATDFSNFVYEVQMTILQGSGGLAFRIYADHDSFYYFGMSQDGSYSLVVFTEGTTTNVVASGTSSSFHTAAHQSNVLAVVANGSQMKLYVNRQYLTTVTEDTYRQGGIGVAAYNSGPLAEAVFNHARLWKL